MLISVLDADVLFPMTLRDTLLRAAEAGLCRVHWTTRIQDEVERNLVETSRSTAKQAAGMRKAMEAAFDDAMVEGWEILEDAMPNHPKDRHVAAAAVAIGAEVVVTSNLKDFRPMPKGVEAISPDAFLCRLLDQHGEALVAVLRAQAARYRFEPTTLEGLIGHLAKIAPRFGDQVQRFDLSD